MIISSSDTSAHHTTLDFPSLDRDGGSRQRCFFEWLDENVWEYEGEGFDQHYYEEYSGNEEKHCASKNDKEEDQHSCKCNGFSHGFSLTFFVPFEYSIEVEKGLCLRGRESFWNKWKMGTTFGKSRDRRFLFIWRPSPQVSQKEQMRFYGQLSTILKVHMANLKKKDRAKIRKVEEGRALAQQVQAVVADIKKPKETSKWMIFTWRYGWSCNLKYILWAYFSGEEILFFNN
jgi:hypothetical protein